MECYSFFKDIGEVNIVGKGAAMAKLIEKAKKVSRMKNSSVLISGESGTGKELIALLIHKLSPRKDGSFVPVNCGALQDSLVDSEFLGHKKGSFTGAGTLDRKGLFEEADGGTIFLDEVSELPPRAQVALLRVLEEKKYRRVGENIERTSDFRVIAATNKDLWNEVKEGRFRKDLYYRLNVIPLTVPPLRERREDIEPLLKYFTDITSEENGVEPVKLSDAVIKKLINHTWEGNVRELQNLIQSAIVFAEDGVYDIEHLPEHIRKNGNLVSENLFNNISFKDELAIKDEPAISESRNNNIPFVTQPINEPKPSGNISDSVNIDSVKNDNTDDFINSLLIVKRTLNDAINDFKKLLVMGMLAKNDLDRKDSAKIFKVQRTYLSKLVSRYAITDKDILDFDPPDLIRSFVDNNSTLEDSINAFKRSFIIATLAQHGGSRTEASKQLKIEITYLSRLLKSSSINEEEILQSSFYSKVSYPGLRRSLRSLKNKTIKGDSPTKTNNLNSATMSETNLISYPGFMSSLIQKNSSLKEALGDFKRLFLLAKLEQNGRNIQKTADQLSIGKQYFLKLISDYNIGNEEIVTTFNKHFIDPYIKNNYTLGEAINFFQRSFIITKLAQNSQDRPKTVTQLKIAPNYLSTLISRFNIEKAEILNSPFYGIGNKNILIKKMNTIPDKEGRVLEEKTYPLLPIDFKDNIDLFSNFGLPN